MHRSPFFVFACLLMVATPAKSDDEQNSPAKSLPALIYRSNGVYSILEAAAAGNKQVMQARIKEGYHKINQIDEEGFAALHLAARDNRADCLELLLQSGADPMLKTAAGKLASDLTKSRKALRILNNAMSLRMKEFEICEKVAAGDMEALREAMGKKGFNPNMINSTNDKSLLMLVCQKGSAQDVKDLIKAGANVNFIDPRHRSVLHNAVDTDNAEIITALLEGGADPMAQAGNKAVPLHDAVWSRRLNSIKALLPAYKEMNYSPPGGHNGTPISLAIGRNFPNVVQLFIDAGIDLNDAKVSNPPLIQAARDGKQEIIKLLLKAGADKSIKNSDGQTAKDVAADAVRSLL